MYFVFKFKRNLGEQDLNRSQSTKLSRVKWNFTTMVDHDGLGTCMIDMGII